MFVGMFWVAPKEPALTGRTPIGVDFLQLVMRLFERGFDADELSLELEKSLVMRMCTYACS